MPTSTPHRTLFLMLSFSLMSAAGDTPHSPPSDMDIESHSVSSCSSQRAPRKGPRPVGVWMSNVDSHGSYNAKSATGFDSKASLDLQIQQLRMLGVNEFYCIAMNKGMRFFATHRDNEFGPSPYLKDELKKRKPHESRSYLSECLNAAHKIGLGPLKTPAKAFAWQEGWLKIPPQLKLARQHTNWLALPCRSTAENEVLRAKFPDVTPEMIPYVFESFGRPMVQLNPFHPEVQKFMTEIFVEQVGGNKIDGIQIDDHFSYANQFGCEKTTQAAFIQERLKILDAQNTVDWLKAPPPFPPLKNTDEWDLWQSWKNQHLTRFICNLANATRQKASTHAGRQYRFQLAPNPHPWGKENLAQDPKTLGELGCTDDVLFQFYRNTESFQKELHRAPVEQIQKCQSVSAGIYTGTPQEPVPTKQIVEQIEAACRKDLGLAFFYAESLFKTKNPERSEDRIGRIRNALKKCNTWAKEGNQVAAQPAPVPPTIQD